MAERGAQMADGGWRSAERRWQVADGGWRERVGGAISAAAYAEGRHQRSRHLPSAIRHHNIRAPRSSSNVDDERDGTERADRGRGSPRAIAAAPVHPPACAGLA